MRHIIYTTSHAFFFTFLITGSYLLNHVDAQEKSGAPELPCVLAGSGVIQFGDFAQKRSNCTNIFLEPLVGASVSKLDPRHWMLHVESHIKKGIHLDIEIESYDASRKFLSKETMRVSLNPNEKVERKIGVRNHTSAVVVVLKSYTLKEH